jgi:hypothetical protein
MVQSSRKKRKRRTSVDAVWRSMKLFNGILLNANEPSKRVFALVLKADLRVLRPLPGGLLVG